MARISLRAYNRDIEAMIDRGLIDEAFAHSRYILERFPKHIDTYRLMGKALLEAQRFGDASDVFHRVLSSVPDDFIAHLGMSIIREDESNLDAAIWHMERSLEVQPSNAAVQVELRRLYGLRDGLTPQKIQLTRGALARMSAKSNLYTQAIAELRTALSNDPQRPDLLVVLAEMYAQTGARMEAVETCNSLISKLPYCLVANRILAEILPDTEHSERAHEHKQRLAELNPYYAQISAVAPTIEQVPDGAVTIERYEYPGEGMETQRGAQPEWAATLGVTLDEEVDIDEDTPDWLKDEEREVAPIQMATDEDEYKSDELRSVSGDEGEQISYGEELPDWMKSADQLGDEESSEDQLIDDEQVAELDAIDEQIVSPPATIEEGSSEGEAELQTGEPQEPEPLPDWMRDAELAQNDEIPAESMAAIPKDSSQVEVSESVDDEVQDLTEEADDSAELATPDWLHEAMAESEDDDSHISAAAGVAAAVGVAALFSEDEPDQESGEQDSSDILEDDELPEAEIDQVSGSQFQELDDELETPFEDTAFDSSSITAASVADAAAFAGSALVGNEKQEEESEIELEDIVSESLIEESIVTGDDLLAKEDLSESDSDIPDWLQDLGEDIGEQPESVIEPAVFDELSQEEEEVIPPIPVLEAEEEPDPVQEAQVELDEPASEISSDSEPEAEETVVEFTDAIPDWLSEVSPEGVPDLANQDTETDREFPEIARAEIPDWLRKMEQEHKAELAAIENPEITQGLEFDSDVTELAGEDVPSWLMSAMDTESSGEPVEISEIEDISEILSEGIQESDFEIEEEISSEPEMEGDLAPDLEAGKTLAAATIATEILSEDESEEYDETEIEIAETIEGEQIVEELEVEAFISEQIETGEEISEPAAEAILDDEILVEGDTQPISVGIQDDKLVDTLTTEFEEIPLSSMEGDWAEELEPTEISEGEEQPSPDEVAGAEPILAEDLPLTEEDQDAAMAWLESLAAKQGAADEELLTAPEDRLDEPPEWIQEMADEAELIAEAEQDEEIDLAAAAALTGLAAGAILSDKDQEEFSEDEVSEPIETSSEWIPEAAEVDVGQPDLEIDELHAVAEEEIEVGEQLEEQLEPEFAAVSPVVDLPTEPDEEEAIPLKEQIAEEVTTEETPEEIPDWLADLGGAEEIEVEPGPEEWTPAMLVEEEADPVTIEEPIEAKIDLNAASLSQLERIPGIGFIHAQRILNYRTESGPFKTFDELEKVHGLTPDMVKDLKDYLTIEVVVEAAPPVSGHPDLQGAWTNVNEGEIETAISQYTELINRDKHLDEVIRDLQEALVKYPQDALLYQALGDAYLHANMLDEALDAYNRAEDFIN